MRRRKKSSDPFDNPALAALSQTTPAITNDLYTVEIGFKKVGSSPKKSRILRESIEECFRAKGLKIVEGHTPDLVDILADDLVRNFRATGGTKIAFSISIKFQPGQRELIASVANEIHQAANKLQEVANFRA